MPGCGGGGDGGNEAADVQQDGPGDAAATGPLVLSHAGKTIGSGATYNVPDNNDPASSNVALFSSQMDLMSLTNESGGDVTIAAITLTVAQGTLPEEFSLGDAASLKEEPLVLADQVVAAAGTFDFYIRFFPLFSGERAATLAIDYSAPDGQHSIEVHVTGSGRPSDNALPFSGGTVALSKVLGSTGTDEQATGLAGDAQGNTYFLVQTKEVPGYDGFYYDLVIGRINADGSKGWFKIYSRSNAWEWSPDPGQNDETGGSPNAIVMAADGFLYVAGAMSAGNTNNDTAAHVMKMDPKDGKILWDKVWRPEWTDGSFLDRMGAVGYAVAVGGGRVFVTGNSGDGNAAGTLGSGSSVLLLALDAADGKLLFHQDVDVAVGSNDRGHAVVADAAGANVWVGGLTNGRGLLMKFTKTDTAAPEIAWAEKLDMGTGSNVYGLDLDGGDVVLALDRRGATTLFSVARVSGSDGSITWAKTYDANAGDSNNCNVVRVFGDYVYAGGRIGFSVMDAQMGDGFVLRLKKADGTLDWAGAYYTGKSPNQIEEHRVKGIFVAGNAMYVAGQVYTGSTGDEFYRYDGLWYGGLGSLSEYAELTPAAIGDYNAYEPTNGAVKDTADVCPATFDDLPAALVFLDAVEKPGQGGTVDEDLFWMKIDLK
jgi:hypothetical protein